uniref:Reverse transcriptase domain-containing protein n=1 Tax=Tanacetum cinerariifolium TaxID=118510 RepID=A0A6L2NPJ4_TANCI|nr:hypothetical protein [Tanacetum cinerariifolium]
MENELWNLTIKATDVVGYTQHFKKLALLCPKMVPDEEEKIESAYLCCKTTKNKRRSENNPKDNHVQQPPYKRQNMVRAYTVRPGEKREYAGSSPLCNKFKFHHTGPCTSKCENCKRISHLTRDYRSFATSTNQRAPMANHKTTIICFEYGKQGHYQSECSKLKGQNHRNQASNREVWGREYALAKGASNQDPNVVMDTKYTIKLANGNLIGADTII